MGELGSGLILNPREWHIYIFIRWTMKGGELNKQECYVGLFANIEWIVYFI